VHAQFSREYRRSKNLVSGCRPRCFVQVSYFGSITTRSLAIAVDARAALPDAPADSFWKIQVFIGKSKSYWKIQVLISLEKFKF
jgi:hypothetical protein